MVSGVVKVELSIEQGLLYDLKKIERLLKFLINDLEKGRTVVASTAKRKYLIFKILHVCQHDCFKISNLEKREPGKGKYVEAKEIKEILKYIEKAEENIYHNRFSSAKDYITEAIKLTWILRKMELRLG